MNNYSFLDSSANAAGMPRTSPSASPSQAAMNGAAPQNGIPMVNGLPSGGQQTDMNHLWSVVQQLSQLLEENKAQTAGVLSGVAALQQRAAEEGGAIPSSALVNGEISGALPALPTTTIIQSKRNERKSEGEVLTSRVLAASHTAELSALQTRITSLETSLSALDTHNTSLTSLVTDYENALTLLLDKLRPYAYTQTTSILSLHKHYQTLLENERATSMQLRLEHAEWQAGLGRVAEYARQALKVQSQGEEGLVAEIKGLKEENRVLRRLAGWEEREDSSDEEERAV